MARRLTIALLGLTMSAGLLAVASVNISPAIPDVVICNNRGVDGSVDAGGYTFTDAFDFQTYASPTGVAKADIQWNAKLETGSVEKLQINGQNIGTTMTNNLTRVGEANFNSMATFVGVSPTADTLETVTFQAWTGIDDTDDYATQTISVKYVDDGSKDELVGGTKLEELSVEDWADTAGWNTLNLYSGFAYGGKTFGNSVTPTVASNQLTVTLASGACTSFINDSAYSATSAGVYLIKIPTTVNFTASGTGASAYPVIRPLVGNFGSSGLKTCDLLTYEGYALASGSQKDIYAVYTTENAEQFKLRLDILNTTATAGTIVFGQVVVSKLTGMPNAESVMADWANTTGWNSLNLYNGFAYGGKTFGNSVAPTVASNKLTFTLASGACASFINDTAGSATVGTYLVKMPIKTSFTASGTGAAAYPVIRPLLGNFGSSGLKTCDLLTYEGYVMASNTEVNYYAIFTAEAAEQYKLRLDLLNTTANSGTIEFGQIDIIKLF